MAMALTYEVLRPVTFDRTYHPGDVVTVDGARPRLLRSLVERRYIRPLDEPKPSRRKGTSSNE